MSMTTMVERVARAIANAALPEFGLDADTAIPDENGVTAPYWHSHIPTARAAIEAMKEPTERMLDAHWEQTGESILMRPRVHLRAQRMFEAMIQAALEEGE